MEGGSKKEGKFLLPLRVRVRVLAPVDALKRRRAPGASSSHETGPLLLVNSAARVDVHGACTAPKVNNGRGLQEGRQPCSCQEEEEEEEEEEGGGWGLFTLVALLLLRI
ncbi:hypothetical protein EYF80_046654 [Liparis tanakae]|uniref:Uncharacterized protein n=1 Tax=Liparis tanakae TaxID=230148 RepID=A0A4Z2FQK5_9TELE|nr:hypothetical protein EYF80_046654 [Liparis tanakae]